MESNIDSIIVEQLISFASFYNPETSRGVTKIALR